MRYIIFAVIAALSFLALLPAIKYSGIKLREFLKRNEDDYDEDLSKGHYDYHDETRDKEDKEI